MTRPERLQRSTESYGLGQSGFTAGRQIPDLALEVSLEARNRGYPLAEDEHQVELGYDDRWTGRAAVTWYPVSESEQSISEPAGPGDDHEREREREKRSA